MSSGRFIAPVEWDPYFASSHPIFTTLTPILSSLQLPQHWPTLFDYTQWCQQHQLTNNAGLPIKPVPQATKTIVFEQQYEPRILLDGELQTRLQCWHDHFNALAWLTWPTLKAQMNALHYQEILTRKDQSSLRTPLENALTLFDENGAIIISDQPKLLELIKQHEWKTLFIDYRAVLAQHLKIFIVGHALFEKGLRPYLGMTAKSVLFEVETTVLTQALAEQIRYLDHTSSTFLEETTTFGPQHLQPFPLLGMPGWDHANEDFDYYRNENYFRPI